MRLGKNQSERAALAGCTYNVNFGAMLLHDGLYIAQTKSESFHVVHISCRYAV